MIRAAIIGISGFGRTHYNDLIGQVAAGHMQAVAATVINQDEEAERCAHLREIGCELFTDHREMLRKYEGQLDLCFIPTGIHLHAPMTIDAMRAGANVFVEKPASGAVQYVREMQAAEQETGKFVAVGYQTMYSAETMIMKDAILSGRIGKVSSIKARALWPRMDNYYARNGWAGTLRNGDTWVLDSPYNNALAHQFNMIGFLGGTERERSAEIASVKSELYRGHDIENTDTACIRAKTSTGISLWFIVTHCSEEPFGPEIVVVGDKGRIRWDFTTTTIESDGRTESFATEEMDTVRPKIMEHIRKRIDDPTAFIGGLDIAGTQTLMMNGAHESSAIHTVPAEYVVRTPYTEGNSETVKTVITGVDDAVNRAFEQERMFSEIGVPWAVAGEEFEMKDYQAFEGGKTAS